MIGTKLAHYEITSHLGTGGMGEVYQATDSRLGRSVAIKLLPEAFTDDVDRVARFEREARVLASLNHPNIDTIHGVEESGGRKFLVMELVPGETLAERIKRGAIPLDESLGIATQITEALEAAHEKGIIHRDLKPANIKVTPEGKVKVLDFGLAKAFAGEMVNASLSNSPTISHMATQQGLILGTAAYMSPEQAKGKEVDQRTDIFALGAVLYEMLSGHQAFGGEDAADILSHVLRSDPDWTLLPANVPPAIRKLLRRCLEKNVKNRRGGASDVRLDIEEALAEPLATTSTFMPKRGARLAWILMVVASLFVLAMATPTYLYFHGATGTDEIRFEIPVGDSISNQWLSVSPDGRKVVFATTASGGTSFLYERELGSVAVMQLAGTDGATSPFWSPDSQSIGFFASGRLKRIELKGGTPQDVCATEQGTGTWSKNNIILFSSNSVLHRVAAGGGEPSTLTALNPARQETAQFFPQFLPDGQHYIYTSWSSQESKRAVYLGLLDSEEKTQILATSSMAAFADPGYLLYQRQGTVFAHRFDVKSMKLTGEPVRIADHIFYAPSNGRAAFSVSQNGVLIYRGAGGTNATQQFVWFDRAGNQIGTAGESGAYTQNFDLSLDAKQLAMSIVNSSGGTDLWVMDLTRRGVVSQFTHDIIGSGLGRDVVWSPDGLRISYSSYSNGNADIVEKNANGLGEEVTLVATPEAEYVEDWSKDGKYIVYDKGGGGNTRNELWYVPTFGDRKPFQILQTPFKRDEPHFSFDTKWLAFNSDESRTWQVYVMSFPAADQKRQISTNGGGQPRWRIDGKELYYLALDGKMMAVDMSTGGRIEPGIPRVLFETGLKVEPTRDQYAVTPDGQRFLILKPLNGAVPTPITVVLNWTAALNQK